MTATNMVRKTPMSPAARLLPGLAFLLSLATALAPRAAIAQFGNAPAAETLVRATAAPVQMKAGSQAEAVVRIAIEHDWHINANPAQPDYMIPTAVEIEGLRGLVIGKPRYPSARPLAVEFEDQPLLVYDGEIAVRVPLTASLRAPAGTHALAGKVRFQACNDQVCLAPVSVPFTLELTVAATASAPTDPRPEAGGPRGPTAGRGDPGAPRGPDDSPAEPGFEHPGGEPDFQHGAPTGGEPADAPERGPAADDTLAGGTTGPGGGAPPGRGTGFTTGPGADAGASPVLDNPIARKLSSGSWAAFVTLFLIGLALNLTPCVYPMLGVTVSIFGARRAAPPLQVFGLAVIYVLGMALMYSALGLVAAFTGGLFGGLLQSPLVLVAIGMLLVTMALSMFGAFELQIPPAFAARLGGTSATSIAGVFLSGLVVGVFAAPCIGPPIVALLALVGAKGDPVFGFTSFFVLAMGLGAPYLVLGTFSGLIQRLPRSGEWMVWVKKVFGILLFAIGAFYLSLAVAPELGVWIAPAAMMAGGVYLGFFERSAEKRAGFRWFKRVAGGVAAIAGAVIIATTPTESIAFEEFSPEAVEMALASGAPVMLDFTADWCAPCHELERFTFSDRRVRETVRGFRAFQVDLTKYDSPESERWRREFGITGVPTILFLDEQGKEIREARVEGFIPPEPFLRLLGYVAGARAGVARAG